jgi:hypothetical protein
MILVTHQEEYCTVSVQRQMYTVTTGRESDEKADMTTAQPQ